MIQYSFNTNISIREKWWYAYRCTCTVELFSWESVKIDRQAQLFNVHFVKLKRRSMQCLWYYHRLYLRSHWSKHRLVCTHFDSFSMHIMANVDIKLKHCLILIIWCFVLFFSKNWTHHLSRQHFCIQGVKFSTFPGQLQGIDPWNGSHFTKMVLGLAFCLFKAWALWAADNWFLLTCSSSLS